MSHKENKIHSTQLKPFSFYRCQIPDYMPDVALHWHPEIEINLLIKGEGQYQVGDTRINAKKGDIIIITPNLLHSVYSDTSLESYTFVGSMDFLGSAFYDKASVSYIRPIINGAKFFSPLINENDMYYEEIYECVKKLFETGNQKEKFYELMLKSELYKLIYLLYKYGKIEVQNESFRHLEKIKIALQYIQENYQEDIKVSELADLCHFSKAYFMNFFKKNVGIPCIEYVMQFRLKKAGEELKNTDMSVSEIAFNCGFRNLSNFNRQFKEYFGIVPKDFRNNKI